MLPFGNTVAHWTLLLKSDSVFFGQHFLKIRKSWWSMDIQKSFMVMGE
jgi:hypothetical protein